MLKNNDFKYRYSTGREDLPIDFFELAFRSSIKLDIGLGYFSSASFNILSVGIAHFINNGGVIRMYINQHLTEEDFHLLQNNKRVEFDERILTSFIELKKTFSNRDEHFFKCLSYLIQNKRIEIKIVIPKTGGLAHEKFGVFTDEESNKVAFTGSMNLTASALVNNIETIDCTCSWKSDDSTERIRITEQDFDEMWNGQNDNVHVYPATYFCQEIVKTYPLVDVNELLHQEMAIIAQLRAKTKIQKTLIQPTNTKEPNFPSKYPEGPRPYQVDAYVAWL